jgi:UDP-glucose 4-epimerase
MYYTKKKILIIGGAGYIGSHINKLLTARGYDTYILDNLSTGRREFVKWGEFIEGDLSDEYLLNRIFATHSISAVMHFSSFTDIFEAKKDATLYYEKNISNTLLLLKTMNKYHCKNIVFSMHSDLNILSKQFSFNTNKEVETLKIMEESKLIIEQILKDFDRNNQIKHILVKYANSAGADPELDIGEWHTPETSLIPMIIDAVYKSNSNLIHIENKQLLKPLCYKDDYIHILDLAEAHLSALERINTTSYSGSINLKNKHSFSISEILKTISLISGKNIDLTILEKSTSIYDWHQSNSRKMNSLINWIPKNSSLENIIQTTWNWRLIRDKRHINVA